MNKLQKCIQYIVNKTGCKPEDLKLRIVYESENLTQFKLVNAYDLVCKYGKNFSEFYNF